MNPSMEPVLPVTAPVIEAGPGALLRQARVDRQWSLDETATKLRLAPKQINALEHDDYEHLPGPTYVRGYLRSYAQLLGIPTDTVLGLYNRQPSAAQPVDLTKHAPTPQMSSDHHVIKVTTLVVAGLVLGLAAIWWQGQDDSPIRLRKPPVVAKIDAETTNKASPPRADADPAAPDTHAPVTVEAGTRPEREPVRAPTAASVPVTAGEAPPPVMPRPLVLHFQEESWADVRDSTQTRLLYTTVSAGKVIRLGGTPPFSVYLGNASGVRVEYQGKSIDVGRHQRGPIARLTVGNGNESTQVTQ